MASFIIFDEVKTDKKTGTWRILSTHDLSKLGEIKWYAPWRRYCFFPENSIFDAACLTDILHFINLRMQERSEK